MIIHIHITHLCSNRALHDIHSGLQNGTALRCDELSQRASEEATVGETQAAVPALQKITAVV